MIKFLAHNEIDKKKWDDCIQHSFNGMIYARSWYLDIVAPGWNALADESYKTVFPLTWRKKYGFHYLYQPAFTQQLGIFSCEKNISRKTTGEFLDAIPPEYRFVEIQLNTHNSCTNKDVKVSERLTHHLALDQQYEKIYPAYSENLRRNIKRAYKNEIELSGDIKHEAIIKLFRQNKGREVDTLRSSDYKILSQLMDVAGRRGLLSVLGARKPGQEYCAAAAFLESEHEYIFFFSAANDEALDSGAMSFLIDHFIRAHSGADKILDFEGSMDKNLARFYKSFGSKEVVYLQIKKNNLPSYIKWIKK